jgi:hypothetical protein
VAGDGKIYIPTTDEEITAVQERFAQLIVGECAGIYDKIDNGNLHMGTDDYLEALHKTFRS